MAVEDRNEGTEKDLASEPEAHRRSHWGRRVLLGLLIVVVVAGVALFVAVQHRLEQRRLGEGAVQPPSEFVALEGSAGRTGAFTGRVVLPGSHGLQPRACHHVLRALCRGQL